MVCLHVQIFRSRVRKFNCCKCVTLFQNFISFSFNLPISITNYESDLIFKVQIFLSMKMCRVKEEIRTTYFRNFRACLPFEFVRIVRKENYFNISRMTIDSVITSSKSDRISYHLSSLADLLLIGFGTYLCNLCILEFFKTKL